MDHRLTVKQLCRVTDRRWKYPPLVEEMEEAGLREVETYAYRRQNTVAQFITTMRIIELCLEEERRPGSRVSNQL